VNEENRKLSWLVLNYLVTDGLLSARRAIAIQRSVPQLFPPGESVIDPFQVRPAVRQKLLSGELQARAEKELEKLERLGYTLITFDDPIYPRLLREIVEPPPVLYCRGQAEILDWAAVAVVGSRRPSGYGRMMALKLSEELASCGLVVVSGLARGVDTLAHRGALRSGRTVAVLGSGLENIYPQENRMLAEKIAESGAVVSEFPLDSGPLGFHFPLRNRIISGLSLACLVVEAGLKSGALITARLAADQGREVLAIPGPVDSELSRGTNFLIKHGARLAESAEDVLLELPSPWREAALSRLADRKATFPELQAREKQVFEALPEAALIHIDELSDKIQIPVAELLTVLLALEMKDLVVQEPGKFFRRRI